jgi:lipopolysaccharide export system permease protein
MPRISLYVLRQMIEPIALFTFLLTIVVWLSQSLRLLDLVINRGQSAPTFVYLSMLMLPQLMVVILPIAFFGGVLYGLHRLSVDSELIVMSASGYSRAQLSIPVLAAAAIVMACTYVCALYLMPMGQRAMKAEVVSIRADIGAALLSEGTFNTPAKGLTVFIRELLPDGHIYGILVHDNRNAKRPTTYIAQSGVLAQTSAGGRLIMLDGTIEQSALGGAHLSVLKFQRYVFDLDQFASQQHETDLETSERTLPELFWPRFAKDPGQKTRNIYFAEGHNRLTAPLYCITFALLALAAVTRGRRVRGAYAIRLTVASVAAGLIRLFGYAAQGMVARHPPAFVLLYLIPLSGAALASMEIRAGQLPFASLFRRSLVAEPAP